MTATRSDYAHHVTNSPVAALLVDPATDRIVAASTAASVLLAVERLNGSRFSHFVADLGQLIVFVDAVAERGTDWSRSVGILDAACDPVACEVRGRLIPGNEGPLLSLVLLDLSEMDRHRDIADAAQMHRAGLMEWQRAQSFFSELERQNQLILDAAGEGIYGVNADGKATFVNRAAQEMLGWTAEDLLGENIHARIHHHHLSGEIYPASDCPIYQSFRFDKVNRIENEVFWRKDGRPIRVEYVSTPIYDDRALAGAVVIFRDITERWESERKLREALMEVAELHDRLEAENAYLQDEITNVRAHDEIIGTSPATKRLLTQIELVAGSGANVFITGESGTGKSLAATAIHKASDRRRRPLIRFNCGAVPPETLAAELFGHVRGAGAGGGRDKAGVLELAHGGTLFLQDVSALPVDLQGRLLRALQDSEVIRPGDERRREIDVRVIAASTTPLDREIAAGRMRDDFYFFLNVFPIVCPALRDRPEDIPAIAFHRLDLICKRQNRPVPVITQSTMRSLSRYHWPGNVRELENVIERGAIISTSGKLIVDLLGASARPASKPGPATVLTEQELRGLEVANLISCLRETQGKVSGPDGAAALMGIKPTTMFSRMKKFGIDEKSWR